MYTFAGHQIVADKQSFMLKKFLLDGFIFWKDIGDGLVAIMQIAPSSKATQILNTLACE